MAHILIIDDEERMRHLLSIMLGRRGYRVSQAADGLEGLEKIKAEPFDMVISDIKMPRMDGMELLERMTEENLTCPVVFITAFATIDSAVDAMRQGAVDYVTKPFEEERILLTVERTLNFSRILSENRELKRELRKREGEEDIVFSSRKMSDLMKLATRVAESESAVLVTGESGTGKELIARYIHRVSPRGTNRFVPVNCAAISPNLVESELFGHEKGSFTGAIKRVIGKFEYATGGTLFLDEIGDLSPDAQAKLLRALQERKVQRVGGNEEIPVDARFICATNQNLQERVEKGLFRQDLYFRINVFPLLTPPLRERKEDIPTLARHFLERFDRGQGIQLSDGAVRVLMEYPWPGNVRELANVMERSVILAHDRGAITSETLSFLKTASAAANGRGGFRLPPEGVSLEYLEHSLVRQALDMTGNNQTAAAKLLGLTRAKFRVLLRQSIEENSENADI
ncbi:MAG TPA: sigma-54 dependent transcriptional regulator [Syntrophales bacterium]|nr:sigma-54 dependent transcriptional regulator [Syntrophales bacterium]